MLRLPLRPQTICRHFLRRTDTHDLRRPEVMQYDHLDPSRDPVSSPSTYGAISMTTQRSTNAHHLSNEGDATYEHVYMYRNKYTIFCVTWQQTTAANWL